MFYFNLEKKKIYSISVVYSTTCIPFQLFTLSVLKFWPFSPFRSSVWKAKRNTAAEFLKHTREAGRSLLSTIPGWSEPRTSRMWSPRRAQHSPGPWTQCRENFVRGSSGIFPFPYGIIHRDPFKINLLWGISEQGKLRCPLFSGKLSVEECECSILHREN